MVAVRLSRRGRDLAGKVLRRKNLGLATFLDPALDTVGAAVLKKLEALRRQTDVQPQNGAKGHVGEPVMVHGDDAAVSRVRYPSKP